MFNTQQGFFCIIASQTLMCMQSLEDLVKNEDSDAVGLGWDLRFYISCCLQVTLMLLVKDILLSGRVPDQDIKSDWLSKW